MCLSAHENVCVAAFVRARFFICASVDALACLGKRSDVCLVHHWDSGGAEDAGICPAPGAALVR